MNEVGSGGSAAAAGGCEDTSQLRESELASPVLLDPRMQSANEFTEASLYPPPSVSFAYPPRHPSRSLSLSLS